MMILQTLILKLNLNSDNTTKIFQTGSGSNAEGKINFSIVGMGQDDYLAGSQNDDVFNGNMGNDTLWGRGEEKAKW